MIICDLCGETKDCLQKEIEGREYDICSDCWDAFAQKLKGKGRKKHEAVFLPSPGTEEPEEEPKQLPGGPPKIFGALDRPH